MATECIMKLQIEHVDENEVFSQEEIDTLLSILRDVWVSWDSLHYGEVDSILETRGPGFLRGGMTFDFFMHWVRSSIWESLKYYVQINMDFELVGMDQYKYKSNTEMFEEWKEECDANS